MKTISLIVRNLSVIFIICVLNIQLKAQSDYRIKIKFTPLLSYQKEVPKGGSGEYKGIEDPKGGFSSSLHFEKDINRYFTWSVGLFYEIRKNSFVYEIDTTGIIFMGDAHYKYTNSSTFKFIGIPIDLGINYLNHSKFKIYQTFGIHFSYLLSAKGKGDSYMVSGAKSPYSNDYSDSRKNIICSLSSSIGIQHRIFKKISIDIQPGVNYMLNNCTEDKRFFDIKLDTGIVFDF